MKISELDATGLLCPLPVLKARKAMKSMAVGERLRVLATDPGSVQDMAAFCASQGHALLQGNENNGVFEFLIEK